MLKTLGLIKVALSLTTAISLYNDNSQVTATNNKGEFIDDIRLVYATSTEEAAKQLPEGYELATEKAAYENGDSLGNTYFAIKRTDDSTDAVTDIRAMNMVGGWSTNSYDELLKSQKKGIRELVEGILPAIEDFRNKYPKAMELQKEGIETGVSYAALVFDCFYDDDIVSAVDGEAYSVLNIFLNEELCTIDNLADIYLQGNSKVIRSINCALMYSACCLNDESDHEFSLERLEENYPEYEDCYDCDYADPLSDSELDQVCTSFENMKEVITPFMKSGFATHPESFTEENLKAYMACLNEEEASEFQVSFEIYQVLAGYDYLGTTLLDYFLNFDSDADDFEIDSVKPIYLEMSEAQKAILPYAGMEILFKGVIDSASVYTDDEGAEHPKYNLYVQVLDGYADSLLYKSSVYAGVDRRIFKADGIALTTSALRQNNAANDFSWFVETSDQYILINKIWNLCGIIGGALLGAAGLMYYVGQFVFLIKTNGTLVFSYMFSQGTFADGVKFWAEEYLTMKKVNNIVATPGIRTVRKSASGEFITEFTVSKTDNICEGLGGMGVDEIGIAKSCQNMLKVITAIKVIFTVGMLVLAACLIAYLVQDMIEYAPDNIVYEDIPEMMVDEGQLNGDAYYAFYTNVKDVKDNTADLTQASKRSHSQWVSLYYTKDSNVGFPIYADSFKFIKGTKLESEDGVKKFGETGVYNVNKFTSSNASTIYITYNSIDALTYEKTEAKEDLEYYAYTLMDDLLGGARNIYNNYLDKIEACTTLSGVQETLVEGLNALNAEKITNYDAGYAVYQSIENITTSTTLTEIEEIRTAYEALTYEQKCYVENYDILTKFEKILETSDLQDSKTEALTDIQKYINSMSILNNDAGKTQIINDCTQKINKCNSTFEVAEVKKECIEYIDNIVAAKKSESGAIFGTGNGGVFFFGLSIGLIVGIAGFIGSYYILKKKKDKESKTA